MIEFIKDNPFSCLLALYVVCTSIEVIIKTICRTISKNYADAWTKIELAKIEKSNSNEE